MFNSLLGQQSGMIIGQASCLQAAADAQAAYFQESELSRHMRYESLKALGVDPVISEMQADINEHLKDWNR